VIFTQKEWVWPVGFFLRARLHFARIVGGESELRRTMSATKAYLSRHFTEVTSSPWRGLPELTNKDGRYCSDSCRTQAWSMATILEVHIFDHGKIFLIWKLILMFDAGVVPDVSARGRAWISPQLTCASPLSRPTSRSF